MLGRRGSMDTPTTWIATVTRRARTATAPITKGWHYRRARCRELSPWRGELRPSARATSSVVMTATTDPMGDRRRSDVLLGAATNAVPLFFVTEHDRGQKKLRIKARVSIEENDKEGEP